MKELTKAEEQVMQILWELEKAFVREIITEMPDPKPAYNTVSTIVRILERKGFVSYRAYGKSHQYFPLVSKEEYKTGYFKNFLSNYFSGSFRELVTFFAKKDDIDLKELDELMREIKKESDNEK
ncbi:BlaI/MecI/CopY family transcriptional regulator [Puteibacter caeruleilacunae]|nr:BlaI/MecI/CopY family transcriptional regulator [Puteibacter caeruleilacunae]